MWKPEPSQNLRTHFGAHSLNSFDYNADYSIVSYNYVTQRLPAE